LILNQDVTDSPNFTQLNGIWATPLEETRLDDYVERERLQDENFNATLSGRMEDAQGRFNLTNLASGSDPVAEMEVFERLLSNLRLDGGLAQNTAQMVKNATPAAKPPAIATTTTNESMGLVRVEDLLAVSGFTPQAIEQLRDYVIILDRPTELNVNTAPAELLSALVPGLSLSDAAAMVNTRKTVYYRDKQRDFLGLPQMLNKTIKAAWSVRSDYFLAYSRVKLDRATLDTQALLYRQGQRPLTTVKWIREY
jgi:general secretion pathway protein K